MAIDYKPSQFEPLNSDYSHSLIDDIEIGPSPIHETNELLAEQNELLRKQLELLQYQNVELKQQAEDSIKEARSSKLFGWV